ncbi:anaerobic ribonucleoside-triphosphate reductase activating protein [Candidatus Woesearchaeota archaeon]|nr:anaerobic ribonucleoside-triphosphate reductase activating protein [Candidatus Woesearchaeota archaeon]
MTEKTNDQTARRLPIKGLQKTSLLDFPPHTSAIVFVGGCNFRCPYCHNPELVLASSDAKEIDEEEVIDFLVDRKEWIDAVVVTGGEPTLYPDLKRFIRRLKELKLKVKLDTNGTNPKLMWDMLEEKLLDYIAMDIKAPLELYESHVMMPVDTGNIKKSIALIMNSGIDYEFRTTVLPKMIDKEIFDKMVRLAKGAKRFVIQQYRKEAGVLDEGFLKDAKSFSKEELMDLKKAAEPYFDIVDIRD